MALQAGINMAIGQDTGTLLGSCGWVDTHLAAVFLKVNAALNWGQQLFFARVHK